MVLSTNFICIEAASFIGGSHNT